MEYPKVLVVGINPWIDNTGINTLISFFEQWDKASLAHLYTRDGNPNTCICDTFFRISEKKLIKSVWRRTVLTGDVVKNEEKKKSNELKLYNKKHNEFFTFAREFVWLLGKWKTKELNCFLDEFRPDVLFMPVYSTVYMARLQNYIVKYTQKPVVLYASDDNYSYKSISKTPLSYVMRWWLRKHQKKLFQSARRVMVIAPKQKEEYDRLFNKESIILTKGVDFIKYPYQKETLSNPIKMVYTGKLIIGRWKSLEAIADVFGKINQDEIKIELDIYTTDNVDEKIMCALNKNGCSIKGALSLEEVQDVQEQADILVFVESLENKYKHAARLSFSTKITDYLKSGKCIFAIGDDDIAPIDYFKRYDSAITACSYEEIEVQIKRLVQTPQLIEEYGKKAYECGKKNHDKLKQNKILFDCIRSAANNE